MNFSSFRLIAPSDIEPYKQSMTEEKFFAYARRIYERLANIRPGEEFNIEKKVSAPNRELFIKIACLYIHDFPGYAIFNNTFTVITRPQTPPAKPSKAKQIKTENNNEQ